MKLTHVLFALPLMAACATTATAPPEELGANIVSALDEENAGRARSIFRTVEDDESYRERVYPIVFGAARERFESGDNEGAARQLAFLREAYPEAGQVRVALLYALFMQRASLAEPTPELTSALDAAVVGVREASTQPPALVDLIDAQRAIDQGEMDAARVSYDRFLANWNGSPGSLVVYVEDVGRYLATH